jgi:glutathione S-transferase
MTPVLYEFVVSHFCEKARWGLTYNGIEFKRRVLVPGQHLLALRRFRLPAPTVPLLGTSDGPVHGSSAILDWAQTHAKTDRIAPNASDTDEARTLEERLDRDIGVDLRRVLYDILLPYPDVVRGLWLQEAPAWAGPALRIGMGPMLSALRRQYRLTPDRVAASRVRFDAMLDELDARVERGPWLVGDRLSRVDLTAASLFAPLCRPPEHPVQWPTSMPPEAEAFEASYRERPFFQWVLALYRNERWPNATSSTNGV